MSVENAVKILEEWTAESGQPFLSFLSYLCHCVRQTMAQTSREILCPYEKKLRKEKKTKMAQWGVSASILQTGCKVSTQVDPCF